MNTPAASRVAVPPVLQRAPSAPLPAMQPVPPLEAMLAQADLTSFLHWQTVCRVRPNQPPEIRFHQLTVSMAKLGEVLLPGIDLAGSGWLERQLAACTEQRLLSMIERSIGDEFPPVIVLPLRLTTLLSETFLRFDHQLPMARRGTIAIAVEAAHVFADLNDWMIAAPYLAARGYPLGFFSSSPRAASLLQWRRLGAGWIKVPYGRDHTVISGLASAHDREGIILCDIDTQAALDVGLAAGIHSFAGRYVDQLLRAQGGQDKTVAARTGSPHAMRSM
jgi:hypothetical protein